MWSMPGEPGKEHAASPELCKTQSPTSQVAGKRGPSKGLPSVLMEAHRRRQHRLSSPLSRSGKGKPLTPCDTT